VTAARLGGRLSTMVNQTSRKAQPMAPNRWGAAVADLTTISWFEFPPASAVLALIRMWTERSRQRRALADLDDNRLKDIGKTREEALAEAGKPFWRA
jgi:uncharacterized protein YjiS (DUF1127 family)